MQTICQQTPLQSSADGYPAVFEKGESEPLKTSQRFTYFWSGNSQKRNERKTPSSGKINLRL